MSLILSAAAASAAVITGMVLLAWVAGGVTRGGDGQRQRRGLHRLHLAAAARLPMFWLKFAYVGGLAAAALVAVLRLSRPGVRLGRVGAGLVARKHNIPWEGEGPLPVERMCQDAADTPIDVPLHPAAERYWRKCGFLNNAGK